MDNISALGGLFLGLKGGEYPPLYPWGVWYDIRLFFSCISGHQKEVSFQLESLDGTFRSPTIEACTTPTICTQIQPITFNPSEFEHLSDVPFDKE